jgi:tetratricopeptide (TPR) repeat protein
MGSNQHRAVTFDRRNKIINVRFSPRFSLKDAKNLAREINSAIVRSYAEYGTFITLLDFSQLEILTPDVADLWVDFAVASKQQGFARSARIVACPVTSLVTLWVARRAQTLEASRTFHHRHHAMAWALSACKVLPFTGPHILNKVVEQWHESRDISFLDEVSFTLMNSASVTRLQQQVRNILKLKRDNLATNGSLYGLLGYTYACLGQTADAEYYLKEAAYTAIKLRDKASLAPTLLHLSELHQITGQYEKALSEAARARQLAEQTGQEYLQDRAIKRFQSIQESVEIIRS